MIKVTGLLVLIVCLFFNRNADGQDKTKNTINDIYETIKLHEQNKAFADLMFGDNKSTVRNKMLENSKFTRVGYSTEHSGLWAELNIQDTIFIMDAKFNGEKLYKIELKGLIHKTYYFSANNDFDILLSLINEQYGPPDYATDKTAHWICGKKTVMVWISLGEVASQAGCDIYETSVEEKNRGKEKEIEKQKIQEDTKNF